ncbi:MAG: PAS domain S-box protein [Melioribacteraceae bacterium]|nr:PAS domain S-box protein [Melioribacteraceae bacterium]MCF8396164.1 PAS domain S-box protein [Melioribacteraceae bacterium]MCF8421226.1 PAS domain S-box protein [Melioribacteraceae bacterium]
MEKEKNIKRVKLKVISLEDSLRDLEIIQEQLIDAGYLFDLTHVKNETEFTSSLLKNKYDIILSDFKLPGFDGFDALKIRNEICPAVPFICVSGAIGEEKAIELMKQGAVDYVLKDRPKRLPYAVKRALEEAKEKESHQKAVNALIYSENRFKQVAENANEWIWEVDQEGVYTYASPVVQSLLGYSADEIVGKMHFYDFFIPNKKEELKKAAMEIFARRESFRNFENPNIHKDGHLLILETSGCPIFSNDGNFIGYRGVDADLTEQKIAENALRESLERYSAVAKSANDAIISSDNMGIIIDWNKGAEKIFGFTESEIIGKDLTEIIPHGYRKLHIEGINRLNRGGEHRVIGKTIELVGLHKNGIEIPVELSLAEWETSSGKFFTVIIRDITARKQSEEELLKLSRAVQQSPASVVITNPEGEINYVNEKFCEVTGYSIEEVIGKNPRIFKSEHHDKKLYEDLWNTILSGHEWKGEMLNKKKNGDLYWESELISPLVNNNGDITNFVAIKEDITEKKRIQEELVNAKEKAEEMIKVKSYFFANMSHELRTPFVAIMGYTEILYSEIEDDAQKVMLNGIFDASKRMLETLNNILVLTNVEFEGIELNFTKVHLNDVLDSLLSEYIISASKKGLQLSINNRNEHLIFTSDERVFREIISNLLNNAVKYTETGKIEIQSMLENKEGEKQLVIQVIDTGIGIPRDKHKSIFDEFRQVSEGKTRSFEGTGLGLAIAKKMIDLLGGTISVDSELGRGSKFIVRLPVEINNSNYVLVNHSDKINSQLLKDEEFLDKNLLYVEDDRSSQDIVKRALSDNYNLDIVCNAAEALEKITSKVYDVFLIDINLGQAIDGLKLVAQLNSIAKYKLTPKIAVTAFACEEDREEFLKKGFTHYISKPFLIDDFKELLSKIFSIS